jgi:hypothetical protein
MKMTMGGTEHVMLARMLSPEQMMQLDAAWQELTGCPHLLIQRHQVRSTCASAPGRRPDESVFAFANDVEIDQEAEIARMRQMLLEL